MNRQNSKRGKLLLGVLVGIIALGIGYAALTNVNLSITGTAKAKGSATQEDFRVRYVNATDTANTYDSVKSVAAKPVVVDTTASAGATATASITDDTHATFSVDGMATNDVVTIKYYVANLSTNLDAKIKLEDNAVTNDKSDLFTVTVDADTNEELQPGEVLPVTVTVKCIAQNKLDTTGTFTVSYEAEAVEPAN